MKTLRGLVDVSRQTVEPGAMPEEVDLYSIPALDGGAPEQVSSQNIDSHKLLLSGGEVLVSRLNPRKPRVHLVPQQLARFSVASTEFVPLKPLDSDPRYLRYTLLSEAVRQELDSQVRSATRSHQRVEPGAILNLQVPPVSALDQRRIADFLDDRVARIDRIIAARREQAKLSELLAKAKLDKLVTVADSTVRPLQALTDPKRPIQYGIVLPGPDFEGGIPIIKGGDIGSGRLATGILNRTDPEIERAFARSRVRPGDYVIAIRGSVGELGAVPPELRLANLTQDSARIAPRNCEASWLESVLRSPKVQGEIAQRVTGSTVKGINIADLRRIPIPVPSVHDQKRIGGLAERLESGRVARDLALRRSIDLLAEYKQSLITAAVTGELDVTTTGSGVPR